LFNEWIEDRRSTKATPARERIRVRLHRAAVTAIADSIAILIVRRPRGAVVAPIVEPISIGVETVRRGACLAAIVDSIVPRIDTELLADTVVTGVIDLVEVEVDVAGYAIAHSAAAIADGVALLWVGVERAIVDGIGHPIVVAVGDRRIEIEEAVARHQRQDGHDLS